jgi:Tetratricopeptide repeat
VVQTKVESIRNKATKADLVVGTSIELVVLAIRANAASCCLLNNGHELTLRAVDRWSIVPAEILNVTIQKEWRFSGHPYICGEITKCHLDIPSIGLVPLRLEANGPWDPKEAIFSGDDESLEEWEQSIIAQGSRHSFEMEQILPGVDMGDNDPGVHAEADSEADPDFDVDQGTDPIVEASDKNAAGDWVGASKILMDLLRKDLRCLDAHAHLGNFAFDRSPAEALRHYDVGVRIGNLSLGDDFQDLLPWSCLNNRPYLRCLYGLGLCLWRLDRFEEAMQVFNRLLSLNPIDNQGARFPLKDLRAQKKWEADLDFY